MYRYFKRLIDVLLASIGFLVCLPVLILIAVLIKLDSNGPVLFKQQRVGKHKSLFWMYKFRTMRTDTPKDTATHLLDQPERFITRLGKFLRKSSLDELPQLLNIINGSMSIIGPRPALWNQYDLIAERDHYGVHDIRPGLTGWAQINGRDELPIAVKAKLDGEYVKQMSLSMDVKCFFGTITIVLKAKGVVEGGSKSNRKDS